MTTRDDELRARIQAAAATAHIEAERAGAHERLLEVKPGVEDGAALMVRVNHRASAIAWTTVANALEQLLD